MHKKILIVVGLVGMLGLFGHPASAATTYVKKSSTVQNFTISIPTGWGVREDAKGGIGFVATNQKNVEDSTDASATTVSIVSYPFTPNERATATGNPTLFVRNFFKRNKDILDVPPVNAKTQPVKINLRTVLHVDYHSTTQKQWVRYSFVFVDTGYYVIEHRTPDATYTKSKAVRDAILKSFKPTSLTPKIFYTTAYSVANAGLTFRLPNTWMRTTDVEDVAYSFARRFSGSGLVGQLHSILFNLPNIYITVKDTSSLSAEEVATLRAKDAAGHAAAYVQAMYSEDSTVNDIVAASHVENYGSNPAVSFRVNSMNKEDGSLFVTTDVLHILRGMKYIEIVYVGSNVKGYADFGAFLGEKSLFLRSLKVQ